MGPSGAPMLSDRRKATVRIGSTWCKNVKNWTFFRFDYEYQNLIRFPVQAASCLALMMIPNKVYIFEGIYCQGKEITPRPSQESSSLFFTGFMTWLPVIQNLSSVRLPLFFRRFAGSRFGSQPSLQFTGPLMVCANQCFCVKDSLRSMRSFLEKNQICRE